MFPGCGGPDIIPVFLVTRQFDCGGASCSRTQFPLRLAYAIVPEWGTGEAIQELMTVTVHKIKVYIQTDERTCAFVRVLFRDSMSSFLGSPRLLERSIPHVWF